MWSGFVPKGLSADFERQPFIRDTPSFGSTWISIFLLGDFLSTEEIAIYVLEAFNRRLRRASRPHQPLPADYHELCLDFIRSDAKEDIRDFRAPEKVQVVFYAMVVNEALELGVLSKDLAEDLKSALVGLQCFIFEAWLHLNRNSLLWARCPRLLNSGVGPGLVNGQEESSRSNDAPPPSSDDEE
ncbi:hypothetical protein Cgig2_000363 [Carnegiea gigantea]|uniref:Uncharacterized protein n=1 Tax=Carnegiea gigantea TaxID=171969 RepID=A0A9Q1K481_9CARY|nr:hypothetical protein Cgig2_000363 [Carnegiea gigantea]